MPDILNQYNPNSKALLTPEILLELGFVKMENVFHYPIENVIKIDYHLVLINKFDLFAPFNYGIYRELICTPFWDFKKYILTIRHGLTNDRINDNVITLTYELKYKEDLGVFIELLKEYY